MNRLQRDSDGILRDMRDLHGLKGRTRFTQKRQARKAEMQRPAREQGLSLKGEVDRICR
jgi:hypothetical protein